MTISKQTAEILIREVRPLDQVASLIVHDRPDCPLGNDPIVDEIYDMLIERKQLAETLIKQADRIAHLEEENNRLKKEVIIDLPQCVRRNDD